jgi:hypothetical protein
MNIEEPQTLEHAKKIITYLKTEIEDMKIYIKKIELENEEYKKKLSQNK